MAKAIKPVTKSEAQLHYESVTTFFKWAIGIAGACVSVIVAIALYSTYSNIGEMKRDMREDLKEVKTKYDNSIQELKSQISDLKQDAQLTVENIRNDSKEAVLSTKEYSQNELSRISKTTNQLAITETRNQLDNIFATDKIQNLIQTQAVKEVKNKVVEIVAEQTKNFGDISDAASEIRQYKKSARIRLMSYFLRPKNVSDSLIAKQLFDQITSDFEKSFTDDIKNDPNNSNWIFTTDGVNSLKKGEIPKDPKDEQKLWQMYSLLKESSEYDLYQSIHTVARLRSITGLNFHLLDLERAEKWFENLKKH